jgi:hypothetical protein
VTNGPCSPAAAETVGFGLDSWVLQDGNYPDFSIGQRAEFALELYARDGLRRAQGDSVQKPGYRHVVDSMYDITGVVVLANKHGAVLDFGLVAYSISRIEVSGGGSIRAGDRVEGRVGLGVDPFFYFEELAQRREFPPLIYPWRIEQILRQSAPWVAARPGDYPAGSEAAQAAAEGTLQVRDSTKHGWEPIEKTDAWRDDRGRASYLLQCRREPGPMTARRSGS